MKRFSSGSGLNTLVHILITCFLLTGIHSWAEAASTLSLKQSAHFVESDGSDVLVEAGTYEVETLVGSRLKLNTPGGTTLFLDAQDTVQIPAVRRRPVQIGLGCSRLLELPVVFR